MNTATGVRPAIPDLPVLATAPGTWSGFDLEDLRLGPGDLPPEASLLQHVICTVQCGSPVNLRWRENGTARRQTIHRGDMILRSQQELVEFGWDKPLDVLILGISLETMQSISADFGGPADCQLLPVFGAKDRYLLHLMRALREDLAAGSPTGRLVGESICTAIATHALQRYAVNTPRIKDYRHGLSADRLRVVVSYIEAHLEEDLSIQQLAILAGTGLHYFRKLFRISTGLPVHEYVTRARISRARHLLQRAHLSLGEIALLVGFSSQSHFTSEFRRRLRVTPAVYRATLAPSRRES